MKLLKQAYGPIDKDKYIIRIICNHPEKDRIVIETEGELEFYIMHKLTLKAMDIICERDDIMKAQLKKKGKK